MPFAYFGSKHGLAKHYAPPAFPTIIEPFAGAAGYSVYWARPGQRVKLYDKNPVVVDLWRSLMEDGRAVVAECDEQIRGGTARHPILLMVKGSQSQRRLQPEPVNDWLAAEWSGIRRRILAALPRIQSGDWTIEHRGYETIDSNEPATWFIDPPYKPYTTEAGNQYAVGAAGIDYAHLSDWSRGRNGQVIVCEQQPADWMRFRPIRKQNAKRTGGIGDQTRIEVVWTKTPGSSLGRAPHATRERKFAAQRRAQYRKKTR